MSARRLTVVRIHPDGREATGVPGLTPARARGLAALFFADNGYADRDEAHALVVAASRRVGEVAWAASGAGVRFDS